MNKISLSIPLAMGLATSVGFVSGYLFYANYGEARSAAVDAVMATQDTQRVLDSYQRLMFPLEAHRRLEKVNSLADIAVLRGEYRNTILQRIDELERQVQGNEFHKVALAPLLEDARKARKELGAGR